MQSGVRENPRGYDNLDYDNDNDNDNDSGSGRGLVDRPWPGAGPEASL